MFGRNFIGLEVRRQGLRAVSIKRSGRRRVLCGGQTLVLSEGVVAPTAREENVLKPQVFVDALRDILSPLAGREDRLALCLPDAAGHVFLLELETTFKNRRQGMDVVRWQLKELLPDSYKNIAIDFQELGQRESGSSRVLVSAIDPQVRRQYEELLAEAGFSAALIDFQSLQVYNCFRSQIELGTDFIFVALNQQQLSLLSVQNGILEFHRAKAGMVDAETVFREINRSLVTYRSAHSVYTRSALYLQTDWPDGQELHAAVTSAFDRPAQELPSPLQSLVTPHKLNLSPADAAGMAAAIGVAENLMWVRG